MAGQIVQVFRIEDSRMRRGPYQSRFFDAFAWGSESNHPCPYDDGLGFPDFGDYFGFASMEALWEWFTPNLVEDLIGSESLLGGDWLVCTYEIPEEFVRYGMHQLMFARDEGMLVNQVRLSELVPTRSYTR